MMKTRTRFSPRTATYLSAAALTFVMVNSATAQNDPEHKAAGPANKGTPGAAQEALPTKKGPKAGSPGIHDRGVEKRGIAKGPAAADKKAGGHREDAAASDQGMANGRSRAAFGPQFQMQRRRAIAAYHAALSAEKKLEEDGPPQGDPKSARKELSQIKKKRKLARKQLQSLYASQVKAYKSLPKEEQAEIAEKLDAHQAAQRNDRAERMNAERAKIKQNLGSRVDEKPIRNELIRHAWRIARLNQLLALADARENQEAADQAKRLIEKENELHAKRLAKLKSTPPAPATKKPTVNKKQTIAKPTPTSKDEGGAE